MTVTTKNKLAGWSVHLLTASSAAIALFALRAIEHNDIKLLFLLMLITTVIDGIDGTLARKVNIHLTAPQIDGALLDNIVDYITYVFIPCYFILRSEEVVPLAARELVACAIIFASAYQFCQNDAKTDDHFFKGFPSYWNITVLLVYIADVGSTVNLIVLICFIVLVFVPIKYVYPSRMRYFSNSVLIRRGYLVLTGLFGFAVLGAIYSFPNGSKIYVGYMIAYSVFYFATSIYRTLYPLPKIETPK